MNQIPSDVVSHFTPVAIGRLLESVTQIADAEWIDAKTHAEIREKVTARLADVLLETMNPEKFAEWQEKQQRDLQKQLRVRSWKKSISEEDRKLQAEWERITATLARFSAAAEAPRPRLGSLQEASAFEGWEVGPSPPDSSSRLSPASAGSGASDSSSAERIGKRKDYLAVAELFVAALLESRGQTATYPKYFPEQTLLAFFVQKAEKKEDLMALFRGMPGLLRNPSALADASAVSAFIANQWTDADYDRELSKARLKIKAERFAEDREFMIYFLMEDKARTQLIPPMVMYSQAGHESMGKATYPDCGETSLRNFFNILLYRPERGIFDANVLTEIEHAHPEVHFFPALKTFYERHFLASEASLQKVRDDWSDTVTSRHPGIRYLNPKGEAPQCEIAGGFDNLLTVLDRLLSFHDADAVAVRSRSEKLDTLCRVFSKEHRALTWEVEDPSDNNPARPQLDEATVAVKLAFSIDGFPAFSWYFTPRHFVVNNLRPENSLWKQFIGLEFLRPWEEGASPADINRVSKILPWFAGQAVSRKLETTPLSYQTFMEHLIYAMPMQQALDKVQALKAILSSPRKPFDIVLSAKPLVDHLTASLKENPDTAHLQSIQGAFSEANFPYGDPEHLIGNPLVRYERMSEDQISSALGASPHAQAVAKSMASTFGSAWTRADQDPETGTWTPNDLIWSGPIVGEDGQPAQMTWTQAMDSCLQLNPGSTRSAIRTKLAYKRRPYRGCFLPRKIDYQRLVEDMRTEEGRGQFLPQIPYFFHPNFWTASFHPQDPRSATVWYSSEARDGSIAVDTLHAVRCVCVPGSWN
jgi:hypothetical protein